MIIPRETLDEVMGREFPRTRSLSSGQAVEIRPLAASDEHALLAFFHRIPAEERGRFFRDNTVDPVVVAKWCRNIDPRRVLCLLAFADGGIVADGTLHPGQLFMSSHVGEVRLSVDPAYRTLGLGHIMLLELLELAPYLGLSWVDAEVLASEHEARQLLSDLAFHESGVLPHHAQDMLGDQYDVILYTRQVGPYLDPDIGGQG